MKFSKTLIPTMKEVPNDVDTGNISQVLMTRAGLIKRMSNGLYAYMPVMLRVMEKVEAEIRKQMASVDSCEVKFPVLVQKEALEQSGRWDVFGQEMFRLKDRHDKEIGLSPTNEEAACFMSQSYIHSYNQLPFCLFQLQKKYRDEIRPKGGVMRTREFTMKDAYSSHASEKCLDKYYDKMRDAYLRIFGNLGLDVVVVDADTGAMGGRQSQEVMVISDCGSDTLALCNKCGFSSNIEMMDGIDENTKNAPCGCGAGLKFAKAYELGHLFKLGNRYTKKMGITYNDKNNKAKYATMGCYGIGVERTVAAVIEQHNDENGIAWPLHLAPFKVNIITANSADKAQMKASGRLYTKLANMGIEVLWDERAGLSPGVKFKDSDLIGIPFKVVVGKALAENKVEFIKRGDKAGATLLDIKTAAKQIAKIIKG